MRWQLFIVAAVLGAVWYLLLDWNIFIALTAVFLLCALFMKPDTAHTTFIGSIITIVVILGIIAVLVIVVVAFFGFDWLLS